MNKSDIIKEVAHRTGVSIEQAKLIVEATFNVIAEHIKDGDKVNLVGFGTFSSKARAARVGRNPKTGQRITISPKHVPVFTAGKTLKQSVASADPDSDTTDDPGEFVTYTGKK
ncbi:HU family DNA-binding protein [Pseudoalteromonas sp. 5Ae-yellow]|uniref:HU family DNA-binding protein n=1 Tax=Pseudoalteromonas sp. 5Ae-yellow TaxID=2759847 RepID=UPI0015F52759|nr:HU family DNA-binding protein [Pseudoalteromonas sp. 5Ae-yellow]MBA6408720.1 HU family DNA-binding protein [Pseudoalteromonas sp. 5Ae-yellow]